MLRAIREIQPGWVVGENVFGLLNWNRGMVFHEVQTDLETAGFVTFPYVLPACGVNAPHKRERVWIIAHAVSNRRVQYCGGSGNLHYGNGNDKEKEPKWNNIANGIDCISNGDVTNANGAGWEKLNDASKSDYQEGIGRENDVMYSDSTSKQGKHIGQKRQGKSNRPDSGNGINGWDNFPTQSPICSGNDGLSFKLDGITFPKWRNESIKGYGNAIVPQVAFQLFKAIEEYEK
jgi:DNA (cytosine-5)-methyltransferase 1